MRQVFAKTMARTLATAGLISCAGAFGQAEAQEQAQPQQAKTVAKMKKPANSKDAPQDAMTIPKAVAVLHPTASNTAQGTVAFTAEEGGVRVVVKLTGVPAGEHGFHIHEFGDCSAPDGTSAGGHFNPDNMAHGAQHATARHVGDLGNVTADAEGNVTLNLLDPRLSLNGPHTIIGRGLILHAQPDDFKTQPTGNAGGRIACGVIGVAKP